MTNICFVGLCYFSPWPFCDTQGFAQDLRNMFISRTERVLIRIEIYKGFWAKRHGAHAALILIVKA